MFGMALKVQMERVYGVRERNSQAVKFMIFPFKLFLGKAIGIISAKIVDIKNTQIWKKQLNIAMMF